MAFTDYQSINQLINIFYRQINFTYLNTFSEAPLLLSNRNMSGVRIEELIKQDGKRKYLLSKLTEENDDADACLLRFIHAWQGLFLIQDRKKMAASCKKVISMFVENGSMYEIKKVHYDIRKTILTTKRMKPEMFNEAVSNAIIEFQSSQTVKNILSTM